jgi:hypothetical protein
MSAFSAAKRGAAVPAKVVRWWSPSCQRPTSGSCRPPHGGRREVYGHVDVPGLDGVVDVDRE